MSEFQIEIGGDGFEGIAEAIETQSLFGFLAVIVLSIVLFVCFRIALKDIDNGDQT